MKIKSIPTGHTPWSLEPTPEILAWNDNMHTWLEGGNPISATQLEFLDLHRDLLVSLSLDASEQRFQDQLALFSFRNRFIAQFGFVIPTLEMLEQLTPHGPFVEIGAGPGTLSRLLSLQGLDVIATDPSLPKHGYVFEIGKWHPIEQKDALEAMTAYPDRTALFSWPEMEGWAGEALAKARPSKVVYIGEWLGCTGDEVFHQVLEEEYVLLQEEKICQFPGIKDSLMVFERKDLVSGVS